MSIAKGRSTEAFKMYTGIDQFHVLGINPDLETLNSWGVNKKSVPEYHDVDDDGIKRCRIVVWVKSKSVPEFITSVEFVLKNKRNEYSQDGRKTCQMIDVCGNVEWLTAEEVKAHAIPLTQKGKKKPFIPGDIRPCRSGEAELTEFIRCFANVASSHRYNKETQEWTPVKDYETVAACRLDHIADYFNGDFSELQEQMCNNTVQLLCGVRTGKDGRMYQEVYSGKVCRKGANQAEKIFSEEISKQKSKGRLQNQDFTFGTLKVWDVTAADTNTASDSQE